MSFTSKITCDCCGKATNSNTETIRNAKDMSFTFNQSENGWGSAEEIVKPEAVTVKIFIECEGKEDFHLCYGCLGSLCNEICEAFAEECHEDGDC